LQSGEVALLTLKKGAPGAAAIPVQTIPVPLTDAQDIALGGASLCVLRQSGKVRCFGVDAGNASRSLVLTPPIDLARVSDPTQIAGGYRIFAVARKKGPAAYWYGISVRSGALGASSGLLL